MIASNYRKHPQAMALQLPLPFGHALIWNTSRPTTRKGRAFRAAVSKAFKLAGRIQYPELNRPAPSWWTEARARARSLANQVKEALLAIITTV